jgi:hypothetical protein
VEEDLRQHLGEHRQAEEVVVVAGVLAAEVGVQRVVDVVGPLALQALAAGLAGR